MPTRLRLLLSLLIGDFSWKPPGWLARSSWRAFHWICGHQRASAGIALALLALSGGGWWTWNWHKHQPKPVTVSVRADAPELTPMDEEKTFPALHIVFGSSVAKLDALDEPSNAGWWKHPLNSNSWSSGPKSPTAAPSAEGNWISEVHSRRLGSAIHLEPPVEGTWRWMGDRQLTFVPKKDWPAGTKYRVSFDRALFADHVLLSKYDVEFCTHAFEASFTDAKFYIDPTNPSVKQVTATLQFTHAVDTDELEKRVSLEMIGGSEVFKAAGPRFTITHGHHHRVVYLRSSPLTLPEAEDFMRITVEKGLHSTQGGEPTAAPIEKKVRVPDLFSLFNIRGVEGMIVRDKEGEPQQILMVSTSVAVKAEELRKATHIYLLPKRKNVKAKDDDDDDDEKHWKNSDEVDEDILKKATLLPFTVVASDKEASDEHAFRVSLETDGQLYMSIAKGTHALGEFVLGREYATIVDVPELPREVAIQGEGGVLALNGERKLAIRSRGVKEIEYVIARVPADQINHLVSQTDGKFQNPEFVNYHFNEENIARISTERQTINLKSKFKANYSSFDFSKHLLPAVDGGSPMQGLFFLKAREWQPPKKKHADKDEDKDQAAKAGNDDGDQKDADADDSDGDGDDDSDGDNNRPSDKRFILVTDLGLIVKENADESHDVFLASIKTGVPVGDVDVEILAKNGVPLATTRTGPDGHVIFASLGKMEHEKTPVAFVARKGSDVAFMPYDSREDRWLDFSRFDIGGVESASGSDLDGFVFTERGVYRPGDEIHIGYIVKQRNWRGKLEGMPVEMEVLDAQGNSVLVRKLALPPAGFGEASYQTSYDSPTGSYDINLYLVHQGKRGTLLGSTTAKVKEFLPDRMKIEAKLSKDAKGGWITPDEVRADVTLRNLYGTPAADRRVKAHMQLSPASFSFDGYRDFDFFDRLRDRKDDEEVKRQSVDLGEKQTDDQGAAAFDLDLNQFSNATYEMNFYVEGFESGGGRSVSTRSAAMVSSLSYVIGYKPDGDLSYIHTDTPHTIQWIALNPGLEKITAENLECRLIERAYISVLTKQENGDYAYESVLKEKLIRTETIAIPAEGLSYPLPTDVPGDFVLELHEKSGARVSRVSFNVVGRGSVSRSVEKSAELQATLSAKAYQTGEDIEISVVAPYTGSGLITIERDKVYAYTWFKADKNSSVQHIRVPEGFEGTGYVNVCFVRALDSREVFMSPLSYAAVPFQANIEKRRLHVGLRVTEKAKPGEPLRIGYKTDRPARIAVFAVDQGILQVTGYELPDPLSHFFRKEALMVNTAQIVDLILPEYSILRSTAAFGGDGEGKHLNPFKRVTEKPVVYWSGIIDAEPREREVVYDVPDYFSGTLTVMAVAMAPEAVGSTQKDALIRGPFVLTPNVPTAVAPGDEFQVSVTVANGVEGSGTEAKVRLVAESSEHLQIIKSPELPLHIPESTETSATFTVRAREKFGSASLVFRAAIDQAGKGRGEETRIRSTMSVRPAVPFMTTVRGGNFTRESVTVNVDRQLHPDFRKLDATVSALPLGLARGLDAYLKDYPNGCSEQLTSGAFCRLMLADEVDFGLSRSEIAAQMERTFAMLRRRQNDHGSFGYWAADQNEGIDFISVYVMHFLIEAKASGFAPPAGVFQSGLKHLQEMVVRDPGDLREARTVAYAIYLLTREGVVTTNYILNLRDTLDRRYYKTWNSDLAAVYLAGACSLLKKNDEAQRLIKDYRIGHGDARSWWDFYSALGADSQYVAMAARHFPELLKKITPSEFQAVVQPIGRGEFNTLSAAYAVAALKAYSHHLAANPPSLGIVEIMRDQREIAPHMDGGDLLKRALFSMDATGLRFSAKNQQKGIGTYYQVVEAGYDAALPAVSVREGLEIYREFLDAQKNVVTTAKLGEPLTVRLRIRALKTDVSNVAIVDLLPGGFEVVNESLQPGVGSAGCDYVDVREDRTLFYTPVRLGVRSIEYQIKPTAPGTFVVPPVFAESMYEPGIHSRGLSSKIQVMEAK